MIQKQQVSIASTISSDVIDTCSASGDYQRLIMDAIFVSGTPFCGINIQTEADLIYENNEVFSVSMSDATASTRVRLGAQKIIRIMDGQSKSEITDSFSLGPRPGFRLKANSRPQNISYPCLCSYRSWSIASEHKDSAE